MLDFYDPDIEAKLARLEAEEDEILRLEAEEKELMDDGSDEESEGITQADLDNELKEVRGKRKVIMEASKMKSKLKARRNVVKASKFIDHLESKGIEVDRERIRSLSKARRRIGDLESAADKLAKKALDSDDDEDIVDDKKIASKEADARGRKRRRDKSIDADDLMEVDETTAKKKTPKSTAGRTLTPAQLKISAHKMLRSKSKDRREGSEPKRLPYKLVPEEQIRLAKKINKRFKHGEHVNEADRSIATKRPKHLFAGKMDNGTRNKR